MYRRLGACTCSPAHILLTAVLIQAHHDTTTASWLMIIQGIAAPLAGAWHRSPWPQIDKTKTIDTNLRVMFSQRPRDGAVITGVLQKDNTLNNTC